MPLLVIYSRPLHLPSIYDRFFALISRGHLKQRTNRQKSEDDPLRFEEFPSSIYMSPDETPSSHTVTYWIHDLIS